MFDDLAQFTTTNDSTGWTPAIELKDNENEIVLRAQLPGMDAKDLDVQVTREAVSIAGEHRQEQKTEEKGFFRSEFRYGKFQRVIPLPVAVQNDQVKAAYKDGVLTLTLPKVVEVRNPVVKLNLAEAETAQSTLDAGTEPTS
jgi:HSP20 family protein